MRIKLKIKKLSMIKITFYPLFKKRIPTPNIINLKKKRNRLPGSKYRTISNCAKKAQTSKE